MPISAKRSSEVGLAKISKRSTIYRKSKKTAQSRDRTKTLQLASKNISTYWPNRSKNVILMKLRPIPHKLDQLSQITNFLE